VLTEVPENTFETWLSKYMIPIPSDQRYGCKELISVRNRINRSN
jgi:hypothetical protein